jgi:inosine-uridine nucleoside N-ribohydrolase
MSTVPVIIDTDPGVDDAAAIFMALGDPRLDVRAITTVAGNSDVDTTTLNTLALLDLIGRTDVPVARGAHEPMLGPPPFLGANSHGTDGLGGARPPLSPGAEVVGIGATDLIIRVLESSDQPVTIIAIAPTTNLADLCLEGAGALDRIREVVVMGGASSTGNHTERAEFNAWYDPEAFQVLVSSGLPVRVVPLDVTRNALLDAERLAELPAGGLHDFLVRSHRVYGAALGGPQETRWSEQHDALAVAAVAAPELFTFERVRVAVDGSGSSARGRTSFDVDTCGATRVWVARDHDNAAFIDLLIKDLAACAASAPE